MFITKGRALLLATIAVAVFIPATAGGDEPPSAPVAPSVITSDSKCPRGLHSVGDYRTYAARAYKRESVSRRAHRRLAYMKKCQHSPWATRMVERYHKRFKSAREYRQAIAAARAAARRAMAGLEATLAAIARCESHGNPRAISPGGTYRGKYQFDHATWQEVGGTGDPAAAPESEQDMRAAMLYRKAGPGRWPICGR